MSTDYLDLDKTFNYYTQPRVGPALHNMCDRISFTQVCKTSSSLFFNFTCVGTEVRATFMPHMHANQILHNTVMEGEHGNMNQLIHTVPFGFGLPEPFPILSWWLVNELVMIQSATINT